MFRIPYSPYYSAEKGRFECALVYNDEEIAYTNSCDELIITWEPAYSRHKKAIKEFAEYYEFDIKVEDY